MKNLPIFLVLLIGFSINAQSLRVFYSLDYKPSTTSEERKTNVDILTIKDKLSVFESFKNFERDSIFIEAFKSGVAPSENVLANKLNFNYKIIKDQSLEHLIFKDVIGGMETYSYPEQPNIQWNISAETTEIEQHLCKKATAHFAGREWVAWFSEQIPISNGPYKFGGLPGLILKLHDTKNEFVWTMIGLKSSEQFSIYLKNFMEEQGFPNQLVDKAKYEKRKALYRKNPLANYLDSFPNDAKDETFMRNFREYEKQEKEYLKQNDNQIELQ